MNAKRHPLFWGIFAVTFIWTVTVLTYTVYADETEQNKAVVRRFLEESDKGNLEGALASFADDFIAHVPGSPGPMNREAYKQFVATFMEAFPDGRHTIKDQIAEGDKVATRLTYSGTHKGALQGIAPTGKQIAFEGILIDRITNGKIVEHWGEFDQLGMMQQLGVIPSEEGAEMTMPQDPIELKAPYKGGKTMSTEQNKAIVRRYMEEIWNNANRRYTGASHKVSS